MLLCTLQDILWQDHKWKRIGMSEVMEGKDIIKAHRKAMLIVHPDKTAEFEDPIKLYLANRAFAALNDAMNEFKKEEGM